jgi:hypothetical protein
MADFEYMNAREATEDTGPKPPLDFSYHFSRVTAARQASSVKRFYKYFQIPGIENLAGGMFIDLSTFVSRVGERYLYNQSKSILIESLQAYPMLACFHSIPSKLKSHRLNDGSRLRIFPMIRAKT